MIKKIKMASQISGKPASYTLCIRNRLLLLIPYSKITHISSLPFLTTTSAPQPCSFSYKHSSHGAVLSHNQHPLHNSIHLTSSHNQLLQVILPPPHLTSTEQDDKPQDARRHNLSSPESPWSIVPSHRDIGYENDNPPADVRDWGSPP